MEQKYDSRSDYIHDNAQTNTHTHTKAGPRSVAAELRQAVTCIPRSMQVPSVPVIDDQPNHHDDNDVSSRPRLQIPPSIF